MSNTYISTATCFGGGKNQKVYLNTLDLSLGWKLVTEHPNKDASYGPDPIILMSLQQTNN